MGRNLDEALIAVGWLGAVFGDFLFAGLGALLGGREAERWRRLQRLPEAALTPIRPVALGQIILGPALRLLVLFIASLLAGFCLLATTVPQRIAWLVWFTERPTPVMPWLFLLYSLVACNAVAAAYAGAWSQLAFVYGLKRRLSALWASLVLGGVYTVSAFPFILLMVALCALGGAFFPGKAPEAVLCLSYVPVAVALCAIKLLLARAYAARFETTVFPQISF